MSVHGLASTTGANLALRYSLGRVSHLLFGQVSAPTDTQYISVTLQSELHPPIVLLNRVPALALAGLSDFENGASVDLQVKLSGAGGADTDYAAYYFAVDLGNLDLRSTKSTLEVVWENSIAAGSGRVAVANLKPDAPDHLVKTLLSNQPNGSVNACKDIFLYYATGTDAPFSDAALNDVNITINAGDGESAQCLLQDAMAATAIFGQIEAAAPREIFNLYHDDDDILNTVNYSITGSDVNSNLRYVTVSKEFKTARVIANTPARMERHVTKTMGLSGEKMKALSMAGVTVETSQARDAAIRARGFANRFRDGRS